MTNPIRQSLDQQRAAFAWKSTEAADKERAAQLMLQGAELGDPECQCEYAIHCCAESGFAQLEWLRRAGIQGSGVVMQELGNLASEHAGGGSERLLYEIGAALSAKNIPGTATQSATAAIEHAKKLFLRCNEEAKRAVLCWLWLSKKEGVAKDIRLLIADLIWFERAAWSDRPAQHGDP